MTIYRHKIATVEAFVWTGGPDQEEDPAWLVEALGQGTVARSRFIDGPTLTIGYRDRPGFEVAYPGDWICHADDGTIFRLHESDFRSRFEQESRTMELLREMEALNGGTLLGTPLFPVSSTPEPGLYVGGEMVLPADDPDELEEGLRLEVEYERARSAAIAAAGDVVANFLAGQSVGAAIRVLRKGVATHAAARAAYRAHGGSVHDPERQP